MVVTTTFTIHYWLFTYSLFRYFWPKSVDLSFAIVDIETTGGYADGNGSNALFKSPYGIAIDAQENIYVSDYSDNRIRKITIK